MMNLTQIGKIKVNFYSIMLFMIVCFSMNCFYLLDGNLSLFIINIRDIDIVLILLLFFVVIVKYFKSLPAFPKSFHIIAIWAILLTITSSISAYFSYEQPFFLGLRAQRKSIIYPLLLYIIFVLYKKRKINYKNLSHIIYLTSYILFTLSFLQYFLYPKYTFLYADISNRYDKIRIILDISFPIFMSFLSINRICKKDKVPFNVVSIFITILYLAFIIKWRLPLFVFLFTISLTGIFFSKVSISQKILFSFCCLAIFICLSFTPIGSDTINVILGNSDNSTSHIREEGRNFFLNILGTKPFFGGGYVNITWEKSVILSRYDEGIFPVDNGVFGYLFYYGIFGLAYVSFLHIYMFRIAITNRKNCLFIVGYLLYSIIASYTVFSLGMGAQLIMPISISLLLIRNEGKVCYDYEKKCLCDNSNL